QAVDPLTVKFTLTDPNVAFLSYLATTNTVVLDAKTVKANGGTDAADAKDTDKAKSWLDQNSAGAGPYKLTSYKNKEEVVADKRVRQAIGYSVDYDGLIKGLKKGAAVQPATIVPLGLLSADKAQQYAYKTDVTKAQGLIKDAGATSKSIKLTYGAGGTAE